MRSRNRRNLLMSEHIILYQDSEGLALSIAAARDALIREKHEVENVLKDCKGISGLEDFIDNTNKHMEQINQAFEILQTIKDRRDK